MERPSSTNLPCGGEATVRSPRSPERESQRLGPWAWGPAPWLCSGTAPEPLLSGHRQAMAGSGGLPSPPGAAGGRRAASLPRGCRGLARADRRGRPGGTAAVGGTSPAGTGGCQASMTSPPRDWPWWQFLLWEEKNRRSTYQTLERSRVNS